MNVIYFLTLPSTEYFVPFFGPLCASSFIFCLEVVFFLYLGLTFWSSLPFLQPLRDVFLICISD